MAKRKPAAEKGGADLAVCVVSECAVTSTVHEYSRRFAAGAVVDLSEEIAPGVRLGDLVRDGTFKRVSADKASRLRDIEPASSEASEGTTE